jgi:hypothetical protein
VNQETAGLHGIRRFLSWDQRVFAAGHRKFAVRFRCYSERLLLPTKHSEPTFSTNSRMPKDRSMNRTMANELSKDGSHIQIGVPPNSCDQPDVSRNAHSLSMLACRSFRFREGCRHSWIAKIADERFPVTSQKATLGNREFSRACQIC